ncbi:MAG: two-component sensor histidine kinase [Symbiobacteriaceae bacterium]|jgi:signal transduction histidine kinase|nr:two-component sensor histidine kinase [Symbiobacteriaceae bacterium]
MRRRWFLSAWPLALQLGLAFAVVTGVALGGSGVLLLGQSTARMLEERAASVTAWGQAAAALAAENTGEALTLALYRFHQQSGIRPVVVDGSGLVTADISDASPLLGMELTHPEVAAALGGRVETGTRRLAGGEWVMYGGMPVVRNGQQLGAVLVSADISAVREAQRGLVRQLLLVAGVMEIAVVLLGMLLARQLTRPLVRLRAAVAGLAGGRLETRVEPSGSREVHDVGEGFNRMATELGRLDQQRRAFVADASHELRTPVASIRALADALLTDRRGDIAVYKEHLADIVQECDRAGRLVSRLLELARLDMRSEARGTGAAEPTDLRQVAEEVVHALEPLAAERGVGLALAPGRAVMVHADSHLVETILGNLVENGLKYTPAGGRVDVSLSAAGGMAALTVTDTGIGIASGEQALIFERFYRVDKARARATGGAGLGLAIASEAAMLLGGEISVTSEPGKGSQFTLTLPL